MIYCLCILCCYGNTPLNQTVLSKQQYPKNQAGNINHMWDFYEEIIKEIPEDIDSYINFVHVGKTWTIVGAGKNFGIAVTVNEQNRIPSDYSFLYGKSLRDAACLCKSWNFIDASVGTAALNAYINSETYLSQLNYLPDTNGFNSYKEITAGKNVGIIGHFTHLERTLSASDIYVLERRPRPEDYPDTACEYILPKMDYVFITGSAFINKTLPRLLQLSKRSIIVGPSTPMSPVLFKYGAFELCGYSPKTITDKNAEAISSDNVKLSQYGQRISLKKQTDIY